MKAAPKGVPPPNLPAQVPLPTPPILATRRSSGRKRGPPGGWECLAFENAPKGVPPPNLPAQVPPTPSMPRTVATGWKRGPPGGWESAQADLVASADALRRGFQPPASVGSQRNHLETEDLKLNPCAPQPNLRAGKVSVVGQCNPQTAINKEFDGIAIGLDTIGM